jgi:hypothetical protein
MRRIGIPVPAEICVTTGCNDLVTKLALLVG